MEKQATWKSQAGYIWALIGSAVGFANILSFSAKAYFHGGGAFLVPFVLAIIMLGIPLLCLEGIIGQYFNSPLINAYRHAVGNIGTFFGWMAVFAVTTIGGYYVLLTGWTVAYAYFSATNQIPADTATFLQQSFLHKTENIFVWGTLSWVEAVCALAVALFAWFIVKRGIQKGIEKACVIFLPLLTLIIICAAIVVSFLPGAMTGVSYYLVPNFAQLKHPRLWLDAFGHIFFSLSLAIGIITGYSRYADSSINIVRAMYWVVIGDTLISFIAGFAIFGCVGYMSQLSGIPFAQLVPSASPFEMGFVVFPIILKTFGFLYPIVAPLFFFSIFIAGITGVFSIIESVAGNLEIEFNWQRNNAVSVACIITTLLSLIFCMGNGQYLIGAIDPMVAGFNMLIGGIAESILFIWYCKEINMHSIWYHQQKPNFMYYCIRYLVPLILITVLALALREEFQQSFGVAQIIRWSWFVGCSVLTLLFIQCNKKRVIHS